jgi:HEAT repeat protein/beta-lactamase regulating signal transducer with metallopeptidase domain
MPFTTLIASVTPAGFTWMPIADAVLKATLILGAAGVASFALRRASASVRHLIWTLALAGSIAVPVLSVALPRWRVNVVTMPAALGAAPQEQLSRDRTAPQPTSVRRAAGTAVAQTAASAASRAPQTLGSAPDRPNAFRVTGFRWETLAIALWLAGFLVVGARLAVGLVAVQWISGRMAVVRDASWLPLARRLASDLGIAAPVRFLRGGCATMPMAWGLVRPTVLMPADADNWPADRLRIVLLHELAHVRRRDCLTHLLAQTACAVYWFHPLAWLAARRARRERERACDDLVLSAGTRGSDYAEELLQIARVARTGRFRAVLAGATLAMAHRSQLEGRLLAILDPAVRRGGLSRRRALATSIACSVAIMPLAALQPGVQQIGAPQLNAAAVPAPSALQQPNVPPPAPRLGGPGSARLAQAAPAEPLPSQPAGDQVDGLRSSLRDALREGISEGITEGAQEAVRASSGDVADVAMGVLQAFSGQLPGPNPNPQPNPNPGNEQSRRGDPRTVAALTAALKDSDAGVRETAMHALVQMRDPSIFDPLVEALRDASADVREQAALGLGQLRDRRAVDPLVGATKDSNGSVRQQAVFALGQLRDPRAVDAVGAALKDAAADVREQAAFALGQIKDKRATAALASALGDASDDVREQVVFALGQLRDPAAIDGLTTALRDAKPTVREQAAFSLGQIRDPRAVDPLVAALKDAAPDVRQQAAFALGQIRDQAAVAALVMALKDADADVREQVAFALGQLRDPRAIDALTTALKDASASVRQQAAFALGQLAR